LRTTSTGGERRPLVDGGVSGRFWVRMTRASSGGRAGQVGDQGVDQRVLFVADYGKGDGTLVHLGAVSGGSMS
jgi:hypothetical protein